MVIFMRVFNQLYRPEDLFGPVVSEESAEFISLEAYHKTVDQIGTAMNLLQAIDTVCDRMLSPYSTEAEVLNCAVSLEAVFIASGMNVPTTILTPSLESNNPKEIRERKDGLFKRIWAWIMEQVTSLGKFIKAVVLRLGYIETKASDKLSKLKRYAEEIKPGDTPDRRVPAGVSFYRSWGNDYTHVADGLVKALDGLKSVQSNVFNSLAKLEKAKLEEVGKLTIDKVLDYCGIKNGHRVDLSPNDNEAFSMKLTVGKGYAFSPDRPVNLPVIDPMSKEQIDKTISVLEELHEFQKTYSEKFRSIDPEKLMGALKEQLKKYENDIEDIWIHNKVSKEALELEKTAKNGLQNIFNTHMHLVRSDVPKATTTVAFIGLNALHESLQCYRISNKVRKEINTAGSK